MTSDKKCIIKCPFCGSKFYIWHHMLLEKRKVKCSSCSNMWFQDPLDVQQEAPKKNLNPLPFESKPIRALEKNPAESHTPFPDLQDAHPFEEDLTPPKKRRWVSWVFFLAPLLFFLIAQDFILAHATFLKPVYRAIGLAFSGPKDFFEIRNTSWHETIDKGIPSVVVTGELANMSPSVKKAPAIRIMAKGREGCHPMDFASRIFGDSRAIGSDGLCIMDQWILNVSYDRLIPGQIVPFSFVHPYDERTKIEKVQIEFVE